MASDGKFIRVGALAVIRVIVFIEQVLLIVKLYFALLQENYA